MKLKLSIASWVFNWLFANYPAQRRADFVIGNSPDAYLYRWYVFGRKKHKDGRTISKSFLGHRAYLHCFQRSDDDRAHHDHPSYSISLSLVGSAVEHTIEKGGVQKTRQLKTGDIRLRSAKFAHRIEINDGNYWTLFIFGPNFREWGFHCPAGWIHWRKFTASDDAGKIGEGCSE